MHSVLGCMWLRMAVCVDVEGLEKSPLRTMFGKSCMFGRA